MTKKKGRNNNETIKEGKEKSKATTPTQLDPYSFENFNKPRRLSDGVIKYVKEQGYVRMTPVQSATIPHFLSNKDVAVQAVTGSGKTLAFLIPIIEIISQKTYKKQQIGSLILSPTRELAQQTYTVAKTLCIYCNQREPLLLTGGGGSSSSSSNKNNNTRPVTADIQTFHEKCSDIVIGTPGRVDDILSRYAVIDCTELDCLILDEADVLLNLGFSNTLQSILSRLPKMRRTALFSATQSSSTTSTLNDWMHRMGMRNPVWIDVAVAVPSTQDDEKDDNNNKNEETTTKTIQKHKQQATPSSLTNYYIVTKLDEKITRLVEFLRQHYNEKIIVFFLTCACVDFFGNAIQTIFANNNENNEKSNNITIELLHGKMVQKRREKTMERYRNNSSNNNNNNTGIALFCTDVAARGLDVTDVSWVVQIDAPQDPAFYIHRVGRSARAGKVGNSLLFLTTKEESYIDFLQMKKVPLRPLPNTERCTPPDIDDDDVEVSSSNNNNNKSLKHQKRKRDDVNNNEETCKNDDVTFQRVIRSATGDIIDDILPKIRNLVLKDRDFLEKGTKAFTSYIRAYKEHHCAFIFRFASLDLGILATSFCLLRLPKMPELRDVIQKNKGKLPRFVPAGPEIDIFAIPYLDKAREQARQKRLKEELESGGKNAKLIKAERRKAEKERKEKERRQKAVEKGRNPDKKRGKHAQLMDEWDDLAKEERLAKKLRKRQITKEEFDKQMNEII